MFRIDALIFGKIAEPVAPALRHPVHPRRGLCYPWRPPHHVHDVEHVQVRAHVDVYCRDLPALLA